MFDIQAAAAAAAAASAAASPSPNLASIAANSTLRENNPNQSSASMLNFRQSQGQTPSSNTNSLFAFGNIGSGLGGGSGPPPSTLDMNEFPSLGGTVSINTFPQSSTIGRPAYVGMVKDNVTNQSGSNEFNIQSEDFPALPGASPGTVAAAAAAFQFQNNACSSDGSGANNLNNQDHHSHHNQNDGNRSVNTPPSIGQSSASAVAASTLTSSLFSSLPPNSANATNTTSTLATSPNGGGSNNSNSGNNNNNNSNNNANGNGTKKTTMHVTKDGHVMNIPSGMINDQYGIAGLLSLLQQANSHPNLYTLTIGTDITKLNMNLNSKERLYHTFPGPWNDKPLKPYEIDYAVPQEYQIFNAIREKLAPVKLSNYSEDLLFFLFYCFAGEQMQTVVGQELFGRDWRFHKDEGIWITRKQVLEQSSNFERGSYFYFDTKTWSKLQKEMLIEYDRLDGPILP